MQKQKTIFMLLALVLGFIFLNSCEKVSLTDEPINLVDSVKFSTGIKPIFSNNGCTNCHNGGINPNLAVNPYQSLKDANLIDTLRPAQSQIYVWLNTDNAHISRATSTDKQKILVWITQGAKNN